MLAPRPSAVYRAQGAYMRVFRAVFTFPRGWVASERASERLPDKGGSAPRFDAEGMHDGLD